MNGQEMPNNYYIRGRRFEYQLKKDLEKQGWLVFRTAGSHGIYDLIALIDNYKGDVLVRLIQCKTTDKEVNTKTLLKSFNKTLPFEDTTVMQQLAVKVTGKKTYTIYTRYGEAL